MTPRIKIASLSASAAILVALVAHEGYREKAYVPVAGDRPTVGFGSTTRTDGSPVRMGDTTTPVQALQRTLRHIETDEIGIKACVTAPLTQAEYDTMIDFAYQYGVQKLCASSMVKLANRGDYVRSCQAYAEYKYVQKRDCSIRSNGCYGVWTRQQARISKCMGAQ